MTREARSSMRTIWLAAEVVGPTTHLLGDPHVGSSGGMGDTRTLNPTVGLRDRWLLVVLDVVVLC